MSHSQKVKSLSNCSPGPCEIIRYGSVKNLSTKPLFQHWGHLTKGLLTSLKKVVLFQYLSLLHKRHKSRLCMEGGWPLTSWEMINTETSLAITLLLIQYFGQCIWYLDGCIWHLEWCHWYWGSVFGIWNLGCWESGSRFSCYCCFRLLCSGYNTQTPKDTIHIVNIKILHPKNMWIASRKFCRKKGN